MRTKTEITNEKLPPSSHPYQQSLLNLTLIVFIFVVILIVIIVVHIIFVIRDFSTMLL